MKLTKPSKTMDKKKRRNFVDTDIGQILIITVSVYDLLLNFSVWKLRSKTT